MKKLLLFACIASSLLLWRCDTGSGKISSNGGLYEVFVVCSDDKWSGFLGDTVRAIFAQPVDMLNQYEPSMDVLRINPTSFSDIIKRHRNILLIRNGAEYKKPSISAQYDVYAAPQIIVTASGPTVESVAAYINEHRVELLQIFEIAERDRSINGTERHNNKELGKLVEKKFGISMKIPKGYSLRAEGDDFIWFTQERPMITQGFFVYSYPHKDKSDFQYDSLLAKRNEFAAMIPGPADGSYMTTYAEDPELKPQVNYVNLGGRHWARMSGFWDVHGDFMGGPFISYSSLNQTTGNIVAIDGFLFSPKHPKRNYLHQLDHLVFSVRFPNDER